MAGDEEKNQNKNSCSQCGTWLCRELNFKNFLPIHDNPLLFANSQWSRGVISPWYLSYRILMMLTFLIWLPIDFYYETQVFNRQRYVIWLVYATNWSLISLALNALLMAITTSRFYYKQRKYVYQSDILKQSTSSFGWCLGLQWVTYNVAVNSTIVITVSYWAFHIYYTQLYWLSQVKHSFNTACVILDIFLTSIPIRIVHVIYPIFFGAVYSLFYVLYFTGGGIGPKGKPYVYDVLSWSENPELSALVTFLVFVLMLVSQLIVWCLHKLRIICYESCQKDKMSESFSSRYELFRQEEEEEEENSCSDVENKTNMSP